LCHLVELQIQNTENNIIPGSVNLLSLPEPITTEQSTSILDELDQFILVKHLTLEAIYHFESDVASVNL
ncbi:5757_t:CDS:2, partial [Gigaspora margarita]